MVARSIALLGCALISSALPTPAQAQTETPLIAAPAAETTPAHSAPQPAVQAVTLNGGEFAATALPASAPAPIRMQWALSNRVWSAEDAIPAANFESLDSEAGASALASSNCQWSLGVSNDWNCKIKPLTRHELPFHGMLDRLWRFHSVIDR